MQFDDLGGATQIREERFCSGSFLEPGKEQVCDICH